MVEQLLRSISRSMTQVGQETGQFRKAAADQNKSIGSFIKDVSKMFSSQNKQQASINSSLDDIQYNSQQTNNKVSQSNDLIQESISIQTQMLSELRSVSKGIGSLLEGLGLNGPGSGVGGSIASALTAGGIGAAAGALGGAGFNFLSQQSGISSTDLGGGQFATTSIGGTTGQILETIKKVESGGDYSTPNKAGASTASGAYQFTDPTWRGLTQKYGVGTEYERAMFAPPAIQDAIAAKYVEEILKQNNNDVSKVPLVWFTGNPEGKFSSQQAAANPGVSPQSYQRKWLNVWESTAGQNQTATPEGDGYVMPASGPVDLQKYSLKSPDHVQGLDGGFQQKLGKFFQDAEASGHNIKLYSGFRSPERQEELFANAVKKYGSPEAARRWVAPPGRSKHNYGLAADLQFLTPGAQEWAHQNASKYGLHFRMGHEPWHIEPIGAASTVSADMSGFSGGAVSSGSSQFDQSMSQLSGMGAYGSSIAMLSQAGAGLLSGMSSIPFADLTSLFSGSGASTSNAPQSDNNPGSQQFSENNISSEEGTPTIEGDGDVMKIARLTPQPSVDNRAMMIEQNASQTQIASQMPYVPVSDKTQYGDTQGPTGYTTHAGNMSLNGMKDTTLPDWYRSLFGVGGGRIVPDNDFYKTLA